MLINESAGEALEPEDVEGDEGDEENETPAEPTASDPLDLIEDEGERAEAKRLRAMARRNKNKPPAAPEVITPSNFATKDDLKRMATNEAKKLVAPEVKALWDELVTIPLGGYDAMDAESIVKNMDKRYKLYLMDNPIDEADPTNVFTASPTIPKAGGSKPKATPEARPLPGYKEPAQPADWYQ